MLHNHSNSTNDINANIAWATAALGCTLLVVAFISPRFAAVVIAIAFVSLLVAGQFFKLQKWRAALPVLSEIRWLLAFSCFAFSSALWSTSPEDSLLKGTIPGLISVTVALGAKFIFEASDRQVSYFCEAVVVASAIGFLLVGFEIASDQWISRTVYTLLPELAAKHAKHVKVADGVAVAISNTEINRRIALATLLFWPAISLIYIDRNQIRQFTASACVGFGVFMIIFFGTHQSSQLALAASGIAALSGALSLSLTKKVIIIVWGLVVFLALPIAWTFYALGAQKLDFLPNSAKHRIVIWNAVSKLYREKYLIGIGADATKAVFRQRREELNEKFATKNYSETSQHTHNVYLQVWLELGLVGAILFFIAGFFMFKSILYGGMPFQITAIGQITLVASIIATSYSIWQPWLLAIIGIGALGTLLLPRASKMQGQA